MADTSIDIALQAQIKLIHKAASEHNITLLETYLDTYTFPDSSPADVLEEETGRSPLHTAIAACAPQNGTHLANGESKQSSLEDDACKTMQLLLENGAIWNQLDKNDETPGCLARRLELLDLYTIMVDAGVRAEMLLSRLEGYEPLGGEEMDETDDGEDDEKVTEEEGVPDVNSKDYLSSVLSLDKDKLLDNQQNGVMMEWERNIMQRSANAIVDKPGMKVLNIGAGMLIFDSIVQNSSNKPISHHIVEAHPDVLAHIREQGWLDKPGVVVHAGKWQDVLPMLVAEGETFDAIYFDTFAESYEDFKDFFQEQMIGLLDQDGKWSYFNGMGADRQMSYDVYQKLVEIDLLESGFDVEWEELDVPELGKEWEGVKRRYWAVDTYRLPVCRFMN